MVMTSPPYYGLRKYDGEPQIWDNHNECEHQWGAEIIRRDRGIGKGQTAKVGNQLREISGVETQQGQFCSLCSAWRGQLGLEPTPKLYIKHLCDIFDQVKTVMKKAGTLFVNLDDSFAGSGKGIGSDHGKAVFTDTDIIKGHYDIPPKSLIAIPERFVIEMMNRGWIRRNTIIWKKPSCMPESVKDRFTVDFEYLYMFSLQGKYYFEQQFEPAGDYGIRDRGNMRTNRRTGVYVEPV